MFSQGADEAVLASDVPWRLGHMGTSNAIAAAIQKLGEYDIIFAGRQAIDGDTAQVGPR